MKLVIRDEKPKEPEEIIEVWLEKHGGIIYVKSLRGERRATEVNLYPDATVTLISDGNFRANK